ncbi:hypothetical protein QYE76_042522 [Lolium multiflorum]|uniref:Uncharacterized protein n=1 Tax=Lolium multiflorum TaxID=4521 RepID=A0AAD8TH41_LOLMU|nr:hypothetical protein QYE76_042522 [Lolium multiflorum]
MEAALRASLFAEPPGHSRRAGVLALVMPEGTPPVSDPTVESSLEDSHSFDEDIPTSLLPPSLQDEDEAVKLKSNEVRIGPITRARAKLLKQHVNLFLNDTLIDENFILPKSYYLCMIKYEEEPSITRGGEEQLDKKLDMELDVKTSHGRAREERVACARRDILPAPGGQTGRGTGPSGPSLGRPAPTLDEPGADRLLHLCQPGQHTGSLDAYSGFHPVLGPKKDPSSPVTWMEYEALRDHLTRELRVTTETFDTEIQGVNLKVDEATTAINTVQTSMTTLQASIHNLTQAVGDIRSMVQQPQQPLDEYGSVNGDNAEAAAAQGVGRGVGRKLPT